MGTLQHSTTQTLIAGPASNGRLRVRPIEWTEPPTTGQSDCALRSVYKHMAYQEVIPRHTRDSLESNVQVSFPHLTHKF